MKRVVAIFASAAMGLGVVVGAAAPARADYFDLNTGKIVCTTYQCSVAQGLSTGNVAAATTAVNSWQQSAATKAATAFAQLIRTQAATQGTSVNLASAPTTTTAAEDQYAKDLVAYYANLEKYNASLGVASVAAPAPPRSPYDLGCIATAPKVVVTYASRMPTFTWVDECAGTYEIKWGYTRDGAADLGTYDTAAEHRFDGYQRINSGAFTPPPPADSTFNGVYFFIRNWKGEGPFDPFGSMGWAQWVPTNDPAWRNQPTPVSILPKTPEEMNRERIAAEQAASAKPVTPVVSKPKTIRCISKTTFKKKTFALKECPKGWVRI